MGEPRTKQSSWLQPAQAASDQATSDQAPTLLPAIKAISQKGLGQYKPVSVTIEENGREVKYSGVPLRLMLAEMVPEIKLETMPEWKALSRKELIMEVKGDDGYPGLVTAIGSVHTPRTVHRVIALIGTDFLLYGPATAVPTSSTSSMQRVPMFTSLRHSPSSVRLAPACKACRLSSGVTHWIRTTHLLMLWATWPARSNRGC
jgi:hypothetical protein